MPKAILSVLCYYHQCHFIQQKQQQHLPASDRTKTPTAQRHHLFRIPFVIPAALAFYCCTIPSYYFYIHVMCCYLLTEKKFHRIRYGFPASRFVKTENLNLNCFAYVYKILGEFPNPTTRPHPPSFTSRLYFSPHFQDIEFWFVYRIPINVSEHKNELYSNANGYFLNRKIKSIFYQRTNIAYDVPSGGFATYTFYVVTYVAYI